MNQLLNFYVGPSQSLPIRFRQAFYASKLHILKSYAPKIAQPCPRELLPKINYNIHCKLGVDGSFWQGCLDCSICPDIFAFWGHFITFEAEVSPAKWAGDSA